MDNPGPDRSRPSHTDGGAGHDGPGRQYFVPDPNEAPQRGGPRSNPRRPRPGRAAAPEPTKDPGSAPQVRHGPTTLDRSPVPEPATRPHRRRTGAGRILAVATVLLTLGLGFLAYRAIGIYRHVQRIDLEGALTPATGDSVNYLLVGSDSRDEFDPEGSSGVTGSRADTIIVLRLDPGGSTMMSVPRDLWVTIADTGKEGRVNGAYNRGAANLVRTVTENLDIPIAHYIEIGFGSFAGLVDALGGVPIEFANPSFDTQSGLDVREPGVVVLGGPQALAFARSRHFTEVIDGREVKDPTGDLGRQQRQQNFLRAALGELGNSRNPLEILAAGDAMSQGLRVDDNLSMIEMFRLARKLGGSDPETVILPTIPARKGQAAVLVLDEPEAMGVLAGFR